jgi:hypothetical protein
MDITYIPMAGFVYLTVVVHHNTHLSMSLRRTGFADRDAIPRGVLGFVEPVR